MTPVDVREVNEQTYDNKPDSWFIPYRTGQCGPQGAEDFHDQDHDPDGEHDGTGAGKQHFNAVWNAQLVNVLSSEIFTISKDVIITGKTVREKISSSQRTQPDSGALKLVEQEIARGGTPGALPSKT